MSKRDENGFLLLLAVIFFLPLMMGAGATAGVASASRRDGLLVARCLFFILLSTLITLALVFHWALAFVLTPAFVLTLFIGVWIGRAIGARN